MFLPTLSSYHTLENSQGSLAPWLVFHADRLAGYLVLPQVRMKLPRYLMQWPLVQFCEGFSEKNGSDEIPALAGL
jgi:hypothetical protein